VGVKAVLKRRKWMSFSREREAKEGSKAVKVEYVGETEVKLPQTCKWDTWRGIH
jgi:hypothetical protein